MLPSLTGAGEQLAAGALAQEGAESIAGRRGGARRVRRPPQLCAQPLHECNLHNEAHKTFSRSKVCNAHNECAGRHTTRTLHERHLQRHSFKWASAQHAMLSACIGRAAAHSHSTNATWNSSMQH